MKHHTSNISIIVILLFSVLSWACNPSQSEQQDDTDLENAAADESVENVPDDKANRPSPFQEISGTIDDVNVMITFSSPGVKGRKVFGGLEPYGEVWRTGANEATTFEVDKDVMIEGQNLPSGKYSLFTIPKEEGAWTVIFNKVWDQWGAYEYNEQEDALRVEVVPEEIGETVERLSFEIVPSGQVKFQWANISLSIDVTSEG